MGVVRSAVERFVADAAGFGADETRSIVLAVDEALTNIIRHAYDNRTDQPIAVTLRRLDSTASSNGSGGVELIIEDHGMPVPPEQLRGRPLEEVRPGGLGVHLISQAMDSVRYEPSAAGNRMTLIKFRGPRPGTGA